MKAAAPMPDWKAFIVGFLEFIKTLEIPTQLHALNKLTSLAIKKKTKMSNT